MKTLPCVGLTGSLTTYEDRGRIAQSSTRFSCCHALALAVVREDSRSTCSVNTSTSFTRRPTSLILFGAHFLGSETCRETGTTAHGYDQRQMVQGKDGEHAF